MVTSVIDGSGETVFDRMNKPSSGTVGFLSGFVVYRLNLLPAVTSFYDSNLRGCFFLHLEVRFMLVRSSEMHVAGRLLDDTDRLPVQLATSKTFRRRFSLLNSTYTVFPVFFLTTVATEPVNYWLYNMTLVIFVMYWREVVASSIF